MLSAVTGEDVGSSPTRHPKKFPKLGLDKFQKVWYNRNKYMRGDNSPIHIILARRIKQDLWDGWLSGKNPSVMVLPFVCVF